MRQESPQHLSHGRGKTFDGAGVLAEPPAGRDEPLDLPGLFGNRRPVEMEIGIGKGTFLLARAAARPEVNFLGVEYAKSYCLYAADRIRRAKLPNVRVLCADAGPLVSRRLADASLWRVHIYFPDPWPKKRHHRRRLIRPVLAGHLRRVLRPGGLILVVTDYFEYFRQIEKVLGGVPGLAQVAFPRMADHGGEVVGTNFERKYITQGRPFFKLAMMCYG